MPRTLGPPPSPHGARPRRGTEHGGRGGSATRARPRGVCHAGEVIVERARCPPASREPVRRQAPETSSRQERQRRPRSRLLELGRRAAGLPFGSRRVALAPAASRSERRLLSRARPGAVAMGVPATGCRPPTPTSPLSAAARQHRARPTSVSPGGQRYFWVPGHGSGACRRYVWVPGHSVEVAAEPGLGRPTYYWCPRGLGLLPTATGIIRWSGGD